jgi:putative endonuclease
MALFYVLFSESIDRFYIGHTDENMLERLRKHNSNHKGFTGKVSDWSVGYLEEYRLKNEAFKREREVKKWKSRSRLVKLIAGSEHSA